MTTDNKIINAEVVQEPAEDVLYIGLYKQAGWAKFETTLPYASATEVGTLPGRSFIIRVVLPREGKR